MTDQTIVSVIEEFLLDYTKPSDEYSDYDASDFAEYLFKKIFYHELPDIKTATSWKNGQYQNFKLVSVYPISERAAMKHQFKMYRKDPRGYDFYNYQCQYSKEDEGFVTTWQCNQYTGD